MMRSLNEIVMRKRLQVLYCIWICRQGSAKYAENPAAEVKEAKKRRMRRCETNYLVAYYRL